jgi:hypothetical protein
MERLITMYAASAITAPATNPIIKDIRSIYIVCYVLLTGNRYGKKAAVSSQKILLDKIWGPADSGIPSGRARHPRPEMRPVQSNVLISAIDAGGYDNVSVCVFSVQPLS